MSKVVSPDSALSLTARRREGGARPDKRAHVPAALEDLMLAGCRYRLVRVDDTGQTGSPSLTLADVLTARELQIVSLVAEGHANKQIADRLQISEWTVSTHLRRIFAKLRVDTRAAMVSRCFEIVRVRRGEPQD